ncbi:hypothetical protein Chor_003398 [Crotalus horridus]
MTKCNTGATLAMSWKELNGFNVKDNNGYLIHQNAWHHAVSQNNSWQQKTCLRLEVKEKVDLFKVIIVCNFSAVKDMSLWLRQSESVLTVTWICHYVSLLKSLLFMLSYLIERGKNCSGPPRIENGDITTLSEKQYRSGSSVEFRCQKYYAMEGQNRSFCDNGTWTKVPICLDPCMIPRAELETQKIEVKGGMDASENIFVPRGHSIELT